MKDIWADDNFVNSLDSDPEDLNEMYDCGRFSLIDTMVRSENNNSILDNGCAEGYTL